MSRGLSNCDTYLCPPVKNEKNFKEDSPYDTIMRIAPWRWYCTSIN